MDIPEVTLRLPGWVGDLLADPDRAYPTAGDRMGLVVELSRQNVRRGTGGPFGAAIFERETGRLLAPGVNLVPSSNCSVFHAEMVAVIIAQQALGTFDLGEPGRPAYEMVASTEPCAMCLGATPWSGVRSVVCGARAEDAEKIGFDEGLKPHEWVRSFEERGIAVERDVLREEAASVLQEYAGRGGVVYNGRGGAGVSPPTREVVLEAVARAFPERRREEVVRILDHYDGRERERVQIAVLTLSGGDEDDLRRYTEAARTDYRDVLLWAEYPEEAN